MKHVVRLLLCLAVPAAFSSCGSVSISKMKEEKELAKPVISSISPTQVSQGWTGTMKITGSRFDSSTYAFFNHGSHVPVREVKGSTEMEVTITTDATRVAKKWSVEVHNAQGEVSNEVTFTVTPVEGYVAPPLLVVPKVKGAKKPKPAKKPAAAATPATTATPAAKS